MTDGKTVPLEQALPVAQEILTLLEPYCERIEVGGSIRRRKAQVKDVEILAISKARYSRDMLGEVSSTHFALHDALTSWIGAYNSLWELRPNKKGHTTFGAQNKLLVYRGSPVDVFSTTEANWGMAKVVRTGPAKFNIRLMSRFRELGLQGHAYGGVTKPGPHPHPSSKRQEVDCPDEATVFRVAQWEYIEPENRGIVEPRTTT